MAHRLLDYRMYISKNLSNENILDIKSSINNLRESLVVNEFLDDLNISKLSQLPELPEIGNIPAEAQMNLLEETQDTL